MKLRRLITPIAAGLMVSWTLGILIGTDIVMMWVQKAVAWVTPINIGNNVVWAFIDATVVLILSAPSIIAAVFLYAWRNRFDGRNHCRECGYNLTGLPEPRCPECGKPFDAKRLADIKDARKPTYNQRSPHGWCGHGLPAESNA